MTELVTFDAADAWAEQTAASLFEGATPEEVLTALWQFTALQIEEAGYQHLLFELSSAGTPGQMELGFYRQIWFGEDEPEVIGFDWRFVAPASGAMEKDSVTRFGAREGEACDWPGDWLPWEAFRAEVEGHVIALYDAGYRLVDDMAGG